MDILHVSLLMAGLSIGALVAWALTRSRSATELASARSEADALQRRLEEVTGDFTERLANQHEIHRQRLEEIRGDHARLSDAFEALSAKALERNSQSFLAQAEQRFTRVQEVGAAELARREQAVKALVEPLAKSLAGVQEHMNAAETARAEAHGSLSEQIKAMAQSSHDLRAETAQLTSALRASHVRGHWGELQLRRVVEVAGMVNHVDFSEQHTITTEKGTLRPDMVVHLPGEKQIVVDAKVSLAAFLDAAEMDDEAQRAQRLGAHGRHLKEHVTSLAAKSYWDALPDSPEFVVMFIPADSMLSAALESEPDLLELAFSRNVVIATPTTLVALLRTVAYTWRQERLAEDAREVFTSGRELHNRLGIFGRHLADLSKRLNDTVESFNRLNRSIDSTLVPQMKRFSELQGFDDAFELGEPLETLALPADKPDLFSSEAD